MEARVCEVASLKANCDAHTTPFSLRLQRLVFSRSSYDLWQRCLEMFLKEKEIFSCRRAGALHKTWKHHPTEVGGLLLTTY